MLNTLQKEAIILTSNILKLGIIATLSNIANNVYRLQTESTITLITFHLNQLPIKKH